MTANERIERFGRLLAFVRSTDPGIEVFGLPDTWNIMSTGERERWAHRNWIRLIQDTNVSEGQ